MNKGRLVLPLLAVILAACPLVADQPLVASRSAVALTRLQDQRFELGLDHQHDFRVRAAHVDHLGQAHARFQQRFQGVRVWGGEVISHTAADGTALAHTDHLRRGIGIAVEPTLTPSEALGLVHADLAPKGAYAYAPEAELVVYPITVEVARAGVRADRLSATDMVSQVQRYVLAYHVHTQLENGAQETSHTDYIIDAHSGATLKKWDTLHTSAAIGSGVTQYNGTVSLNTNSVTSGYELRDMTRGTGGTFSNNVITNLNHATSGNGTIFTDADNTWGNGANYTGSSTSTTSATGQTAAADAAFGAQVTWDMYKNVLSRNGIDGAGKATYSRVHYSTSYDNAFWDDTCFCMTYGDGSSFKSLEAMDVAGHEMSHGVCANTADLTYSGESGGLNEANSDIFGTMAEFYAKGGGFAAASTTIPSTGGNWTIGEQLASTPLRYMYKPSKDGSSPDAWSSSVGNLDVHYSSGPMNRAFYFLSQGSSATSGDYYTSYLPSGMTGVGNDMAARIWYRALSVYLTSSSNYAAARAGAISAAKDLYGAGSAAEQAVWNAFHGINVGAAWTGSSSNTVTASITTPSANVTVASGTAQSFVGTATDSSSSATLTYAWTFGDGGTATGASASHTFTNTGTSNVTYTVTFKATDNTGATASATRTVTVTPGGTTTGTELIVNGGFESSTTGWTGTTAVIGTFTAEPAYAGTRDAFFGGKGTTTTQNLYQSVTIPSTATSATLRFYLHIDTKESGSTAYDYFYPQVLNSTGTLLKSLATYNNANSATGYVLRSFDLSAYKGQTVRINFKATEDSSLATSFVVDNVSLIVK